PYRTAVHRRATGSGDPTGVRRHSSVKATAPTSPERLSTAPKDGLSLPSLWAFASVVLPIVAALRATIATNDLAYQIRAGNLMLFTHHLLRHDVFTFTAAGRAWTDQQWGAQIAFALIWRAGGWAALALFR